MTEAEITAAYNHTPHGANVWIEWERPAKLRAANSTMPLTKYTRKLCRLGVEYDHMQVVKDGRADGNLPATPQPLIGREWIAYPYLMRFVKSGKLALRLQAGTFKTKSISEYRLDGLAIPKEDAYKLCTSAELPSKNDTGTFDVTIDSIISIHGMTANELATMEVEEAEETE